MQTKNKGFTLVELLAVLLIIMAIGLITFPLVTNYLKDSKQRLYDIQIENIELALRAWASDNKINLPEEDGQTITLTLLQLKQSDFIEKDLRNPLTQYYFPDDMTLTITRSKNTYQYRVNKDTGSTTVFDEIEPDAPSIFLIGNTLEYVELKSEYKEKGVIASSYNGTTIKKYETEISGSGTIIDTSKINRYTIKYTVIDPNNGMTASVTRTLIVRDTIPPDLIIPGNIEIEKTVTSFDIMTGVSATDNSGGEVTIKTKHNLTLGVPGKYIVTYTATDSYGNETSMDRIIQVNN